MRYCALHHSISLATAAAFLVATACSHTVTMPREKIDGAAGRDAKYAYQIDTRSQDRYLVKRYSLTDSTLVIEQLAPIDKRYGDPGVRVPIELQRDTIAVVSTMRVERTGLLIFAGGLFATFIVWAILFSIGD